MKISVNDKEFDAKQMVIASVVAVAVIGASFGIGNSIGNNASFDKQVIQEAAGIQNSQEKSYIDLQEKLKGMNADIDAAKETLGKIKEYTDTKGAKDKEIADKNAQIKELNVKITQLNTDIQSKNKELVSVSGKIADAKAAPITLSAGNYICGKDFPAGTYDIRWVSGHGNFFGRGNARISEMIGSDPRFYIKEYKNATFSEGDTIEIKGSLKVNLVPKAY